MASLFQIASAFQSHRSSEAKESFSRFEGQNPPLAGRVFGNLWRLKGSPTNLDPDYGRHAFHDAKGFFSQDSEKAEAIFLVDATVELRLQAIAGLFKSRQNTEALKRFEHFQTVYPQIAERIYGNVWKVYGQPTPQTHPLLAHHNFGALVFHDQHTQIADNPMKKAQAIEMVLPEVPDLAFTPEQSKMRRERRCLAVIGEHLQILKQGFYIAPSGQSRTIDATTSIAKTFICRDDTLPRRAQDNFQTVFEVRPQNCVTIAYELAKSGEKVNVMNFANSDHPGGAYLRGAGTQEEELFRCTTLPLILDKTHGKQPGEFYPIDAYAGPSGGLCSPGVTLFRAGLDADYQLLEQPVEISVGTFAAIDKPILDYTDPQNPRLHGENHHRTFARIRTYFKSALVNGDEVAIVGAFGCGAFANPPQHIAEMMMELLQKDFRGSFKKVIFAVLKDGNEGKKHNPKGNFAPFADIVKKHGGSVFGTSGERL